MLFWNDMLAEGALATCALPITIGAWFELTTIQRFWNFLEFNDVGLLEKTTVVVTFACVTTCNWCLVCKLYSHKIIPYGTFRNDFLCSQFEMMLSYTKGKFYNEVFLANNDHPVIFTPFPNVKILPN